MDIEEKRAYVCTVVKIHHLTLAEEHVEGLVEVLDGYLVEDGVDDYSQLPNTDVNMAVFAFVATGWKPPAVSEPRPAYWAGLPVTETWHPPGVDPGPHMVN